jgi:hypothetical protein
MAASASASAASGDLTFSDYPVSAGRIRLFVIVPCEVQISAAVRLLSHPATRWQASSPRPGAIVMQLTL